MHLLLLPVQEVACDTSQIFTPITMKKKKHDKLIKGRKHSGIYHRFLCILVVRVPANAHHHFVDITITNTGPAIVDPCPDIFWKMVHH